MLGSISQTARSRPKLKSRAKRPTEPPGAPVAYLEKVKILAKSNMFSVPLKRGFTGQHGGVHPRWQWTAGEVAAARLEGHAWARLLR